LAEEFGCYMMGILALPNLIAHLSSAAFAQARLRAGSASAQVYSGLLRSAYPHTLIKKSVYLVCAVYKRDYRALLGSIKR
jgi:hypothetical protein